MSQKKASGHPVVTFCAILAEVGAISIIHPVFSGATGRKERGVCACLSATISNPIYLDYREIIPSGSTPLFHFHLYLTSGAPTHPSLKLLFGQALWSNDLWTILV